MLYAVKQETKNGLIDLLVDLGIDFDITYDRYMFYNDRVLINTWQNEYDGHYYMEVILDIFKVKEYRVNTIDKVKTLIENYFFEK